MKKYGVWVTRTITESAFIIVEAEDEDQAEEKAYDRRNELEYEADDNAPLDYDINIETWEE